MEGSWKHNGQGVANNSQLKTSSKRLNCTTGVLTTATGWNLTQFRSGGCTFETNLAGLAFVLFLMCGDRVLTPYFPGRGEVETCTDSADTSTLPGEQGTFGNWSRKGFDWQNSQLSLTLSKIWRHGHKTLVALTHTHYC